MKCYWTVNSSYWPLLRVSQYEVNTSWPPQQKSIVLQYWKPKINSFSYAEKKKLWRMCTNFWINPHNGKLLSRLAPAQCQNSLAPQLLSNIYWSTTKTSISLNRVYWYDTMCHIFSCLCCPIPHAHISRPFSVFSAGLRCVTSRDKNRNRTFQWCCHQFYLFEKSVSVSKNGVEIFYILP